MSDHPIPAPRDLLEEYALGLLDASERAAFEAQLGHDPELQRELAATLNVLSDLAFSAPVVPRADLKDRVMARIATPPARRDAGIIPLAVPARRARVPLWLGAALAASLALVAKLSFDLRDARRDSRADTSAIASRDQALAQRDGIIAQLTDSSVQVVTLAATGPARPIVRAYLNRARRTIVLAASALETLPPGQAYQLWFIVDGKPVPSRTFMPDSTGHALVTAVPMPAGAVAATAITREPAGGSLAPTSPILFMAKLATE